MTLRRVLLSLLLFAWAPAVLAQTPCPAGDINEHQGAWRSRPFPMPSAQFRAPAGSYNRAAADATLETILGLLRAAYPQPTGAMAYFDKKLSFSSPYPGLPLGYHLYVGVAGFYCSAANTLDELSESGVFINVDVNSFGMTDLLVGVDAPAINTSKGELRLSGDERGQYLISGKRVYRIPAAAGEHRSVDHYTRHEYTRPGAPPDRQWFVVRKPDVPLFSYVTRREYVAQFRTELETSARVHVENSREFAQVTGDPGAAEQEARFTRMMGAYLRAVDNYLRHSPEEELSRAVAEPLMLFPRDPDNPAVRFLEGDRVMAYLNPDYMDARLPHHVPQFIVMQLAAGARRHPWETTLRERVTDGLDLEALSGLIAK